MSEATPPQPPQPSGHQSGTQRFARFITNNRFPVAMFLIFSSLFFFYPILNTITGALGYTLPGPIVRINTDARSLFPDHPYVHAQDKFAKTFGSSSLVAIAVTVDEGTIFKPEIINAIREITRELDGIGFDSQSDARDERRDELEEDETLSVQEVRDLLDREFPPYPVNHDQVRSFTHNSTRVFQIMPDGAIEQDVLMPKVPETQEEADALGELVRQNPPVIFGRLVSRDEKGALITAGFVTDRLSSRETYMAVFNHVQAIKKKWEAEIPGLNVYVSGGPIGVGWIITHAFQILGFVMATIGMIFLLLWLYFRRWHGVLIPAIAAFMTAVWGLGFTGLDGHHLRPADPRDPDDHHGARGLAHGADGRALLRGLRGDAADVRRPEGRPRRGGHHRDGRADRAGHPRHHHRRRGPAGHHGDLDPSRCRNLAIFGAFWVASIIITVEILHPILICYMPAPTEHEHFLPSFMVRFTRFIGDITTHPTWKYVIGGTTVVLFVICTYIALFHSKIGVATSGTPLLWPDHEFNVATGEIAQKFGGVDSLVVYSDGDRPNASADADPIKAMERFERALKIDTNLGASVSVVPFLRQMWRINHYGDPKWFFVPDHPGTVRAMIFQLQQNGAPGFMRPFMTDDGRKANIAFFYPDQKGDTIIYATHYAEKFIEENPLGEINIRLDMDKGNPDDGFFERQNLLDKWYYMLGPLLPPRHHTLTVRIRQEDGSYVDSPVKHADVDGLPDWIDEFAEEAMVDYEDAADVDEDEIFTWPENLAEWTTDDVGQWWESEEYGIRAVETHTKNLIVADLKAVDPVPKFQPTLSWTRGVQFVMAGGSMGILAAINDEVERSHVANISLIFFVIFVLHSVTYKSVPSGAIILLQIATATMMSLAYMAVRGIGLNVNTLPVQSVGVGIGVDYAIYIVDRIRQEVADTADIDEAVRRAVRTTGMAVSFTATTITGGIVLWVFSDLRFQAEMAYLLVILMILNMFGAITVVPAFYSILRPKVATALLTDEQKEAIRIQKEREKELGLRDADE